MNAKLSWSKEEHLKKKLPDQMEVNVTIIAKKKKRKILASR